MFEPLAEGGRWIASLVPDPLHIWKIKPNFIIVHYFYMICMAIAASIILFGASFIPYIDALFFAAGTATQSGLNTIDINKLHLYQQITMFFVANITNPIFINTFVVFVRLYWFEKRFQHVVRQAREHRRGRAKFLTRTKSGMKEHNVDPHHLELGVNGRNIKVLHETTKPNGMTGTTARSKEEEEIFKEKMGLEPHAESVEPTPEGSNKSSAEDVEEGAFGDQQEKASQVTKDAVTQSPVSATSAHHLGLNPRLHREITFADEVSDPGHPGQTSELARVPEQVDISKHIEFLQRQQRDAKAGKALHIPGPRDFDRGEVPHQLASPIDDGLHRVQTRNTLAPIISESEREGMNTDGTEELNGDDHPERGGIKFDEQEHPARRQDFATFDRATTQGSRFGLSRIKSNVGSALRQRRSNNNQKANHLHLSQAKGSLGRTFSTLTTVLSTEKKDNDPMPYLSWAATTGRNSAFLGLSEEQREELGGIEYRSLKTLVKVLICYFIGFHLLGLVTLLPWIERTNPWKQIVVDDAINPSWWGVFTPSSMFNDLGFTLTPDSMISFQQAALPLLIGSFLIVIGNTGFPVMLRFVIWVASKLAPHGSGTWEELKFLLDHPRRCFTLLFPSKATWWLFWILVGLNGIDLLFFIILDLHDPVVTSIPTGYRILDGWFQAASTRTAGFSCVNLYELHPAIQVSYMIMMYISVFPIAISVRRTNVYEEKSLGIWGGEETPGTGEGEDPSYVGQHLRRQLSFDLWYIFLGFFIICIVEGDRLGNTNDEGFTMFSVLFEIVSAYGTVGLSLGYPGINASFSAEFRVISKLVIIAMMIRGRHRGLPYALDRAILLPSEHLQKKEAEDADRRAMRRGSIFAEGHEAERLRHGASWSQTDLDENGLPKQNLAAFDSPVGRRNSAYAVMDHDDSLEPVRGVRRTESGMSTGSRGRVRRERSRSLGRVIVGGLSAGPSIPKHD